MLQIHASVTYAMINNVSGAPNQFLRWYWQYAINTEVVRCSEVLMKLGQAAIHHGSVPSPTNASEQAQVYVAEFNRYELHDQGWRIGILTDNQRRIQLHDEAMTLITPMR